MGIITWVKRWVKCAFEASQSEVESYESANNVPADPTQKVGIPGRMLVDLTSLGMGLSECTVALTESDGGVLEDFFLVIENLNIDQINKIFDNSGLKPGAMTSGTLTDGRTFQGTIALFSSYRPGMAGSIAINGKLSNVSISNAISQNRQPSTWSFVLSNFKISFGDVLTTYPAEMRQSNDAIIFEVGGRQWRLTDRYLDRWSKLSKEERKAPLASGLLTTPYANGDSDSSIQTAAQDICDVLAVAISRSVTWVSYEIKDTSGRSIRGFSRSTWVTGFDKCGFSPVDNHEAFALKNLLEKAVPVVAAEREWYSKTLSMLTQAQIADMLDVRCSILYTLADRISTHIVKKTGVAEIDKDLKGRARKPEFEESLHGVLNTLSPEHWTIEHTRAVISEVKRWNSMPTFVAKIQRACKQLDIPEPDRTLLQPRNDLLHDGELDPGDADAMSHYLELDWVVLAMTLRLFGYQGVYYHPKFGHAPATLSDHLIQQPAADPA